MESLLLCDSAQFVDAKLYILGGGWEWVHASDDVDRVPLCVAVRFRAPKPLLNTVVRMRIVVQSRSHNGQETNGRIVEFAGRLTPPPIDSTLPTFGGGLVQCFRFVFDKVGLYVCEFSIEDVVMATTHINVIPPGGEAANA